MTERTLFCRGWEFCFDPRGGSEPPTDTHWQAVTLPHDWQIWHAKNLYQDGTGWYRTDISRKEGLSTRLYFEGVYMDSTVFVNGVPVKEWKYGYSSFEVDLTDYLTQSRNTLMVRCCLRHPNSRWYSGAGIYRDVWRIDSPISHFLSDGLYIAAKELSQDRWQVTVRPEVENFRPGDKIQYTLLAPDGCTAATAVGVPDSERVFFVECPRLWSTESPCCYRLQAELLRDGFVIDRAESVCGFRTLTLDPEKGFFLNHRRMVLHGVCLHHDLGCLGAAFSLCAARRQLEIMKDMGVNALRTAHNMPAPGILQLADEMGFLIVDEAFDCWTRSKTPYDYARFFPDWYAADVAGWVRRDRNHPCLLFWSVGNEIYDTHLGPQGKETLRQLTAEVRRYDPLKNGLLTLGSNYMAWENTQNCVELVDAIGYNYGEPLYDAHHTAHPNWVIYGSETASVVQSRGVYHFPLSRTLLVDDDLQCSSLGNSRTSWGAPNHRFCIAADEEHPYTLGQFLWAGIDYIGEPTPYHTRNSYLGLVDTAGFPKDDYYTYQAGWHRWQEKPVLHLLPYWDFNPGQLIDICILSNLPQVELLVNGRSLGRKALQGGSDIRACWQADYEPGKIEAIGYDDNGKIIARARESSFTDPVRLRIEADRESIDSSGRTLVFCTVTAEDAEGNPVRNANTPVQIRLSSGLKLLGTDNGNSVDPDEYKTDCRRLFSGKLLVVAAACGDAGCGSITVSSPGLAAATVNVRVDKAPGENFPILPEISPGSELPATPVRKLELHAVRCQLDPEHPSTIVSARVLPEGAAAEKISWRVTDDRGVSILNASLEAVDDRTVRVIGKADGAIRIRCSCGLILSGLEMTLSGFGSLSLDPHAGVSAALYTASFGTIGNGNDRGIATPRGEQSWVAYEKLDFGPVGSDTLTINIFELASTPTPIRFWKGIPYAPGSRMIGQRIYDKQTKWNVYQPETFTLDERLTGTDVFGIELDTKVHIRDFTFRRRSRAWELLPAAGYDLVYGDSFRLTEDAVEGIGNNVSLVFRGMDFGSCGSSRIRICGKSALENNTIHLRFENEDRQIRQTVEFPGCESWQEIEFPLDRICGTWDLTFLFLPGCDFDFQSFQFIRNNEP